MYFRISVHSWNIMKLWFVKETKSSNQFSPPPPKAEAFHKHLKRRSWNRAMSNSRSVAEWSRILITSLHYILSEYYEFQLEHGVWNCVWTGYGFQVLCPISHSEDCGFLATYIYCQCLHAVPLWKLRWRRDKHLKTKTLNQGLYKH